MIIFKESQRAGKQAEILESEGVLVTDGRVDLAIYQWRPGSEGFPDAGDESARRTE